MEAFQYIFPALRGIQAGREYYLAMCPLKLLPRLFVFDEAGLSPEMRAQRTINRARVPDIARYIIANPGDYVFSAITASIDGDVRFEADASGGHNIGRLVVPMQARFIINDGQHRRAAIEEALAERPELGEETISVVFFIDVGLKRTQQMFADLNRHAVRPTKSIGVLYDHRDALSQLACRIAERVDVFRGMTELERTTISNRSTKLFTLSSIYLATRRFLKKGRRATVSAGEEELAIAFWNEVAKHIPDWRKASAGTVAPAELRKDCIHAHGVALQALAIAGSDLLAHEPSRWKSKLKHLQKLDWKRSNRSQWEGRATIGGRVSKAEANVQLTANVIKKVMGLSLTDRDKRMEVA